MSVTTLPKSNHTCTHNTKSKLLRTAELLLSSSNAPWAQKCITYVYIAHLLPNKEPLTDNIVQHLPQVAMEELVQTARLGVEVWLTAHHTQADRVHNEDRASWSGGALLERRVQPAHCGGHGVVRMFIKDQIVYITSLHRHNKWTL